MQGRISRPFGMVITVFLLGVGGSFFWYGCHSQPVVTALVETITPAITATYTPTSTVTVAPTVTVTRTPHPTPTATPDLRVLNSANQHLYL